jgi:hypothetical protein
VLNRIIEGYIIAIYEYPSGVSQGHVMFFFLMMDNKKLKSFVVFNFFCEGCDGSFDERKNCACDCSSAFDCEECRHRGGGGRGPYCGKRYS